MHDVIERYGFKLVRGRMACPFHNGKDNNFSVSKHVYHCFVCGESGDIFNFVMRYFGLDFNEALKKLDADFGLGLFEDMTQAQRRDFAKRSFQLRKERQLKEEERTRLTEAVDRAMDEAIRLERNRLIYKPKGEDEELHPLFIEALQKGEAAEYALEIAREELHEYERNS